MPEDLSDKRGGDQTDQENPTVNAAGAGLNKQRYILHRLSLIIFLLLVAIGLTFVLIKHNDFMDAIRLRGYKAPAEVSSLASQTGMTSYAKRMLYVNYPAVEDKEAFNSHCPNASKEIAVLGCYLGNRKGIYIYRVTDQRLNGIEQVTTAHEMLHQAYERLNTSERKRIDKLLEDYAKSVTDENLKKKMDAYKNLSAADINNERHSVFGTEVAKLPRELEEYYKRYFTDRSKLVAYYQQYNLAFTERQDQIEAYDAQLKQLEDQINSSKDAISSQEASLEAERSAMDSYLKENQVVTYNAAVPGFNARVQKYKQDVVVINAMIDQYNSIVEKRNAIAVEQQQLIKAEDSRSAVDADTH